MLILEDGKLWGASGRRKPLLSEFINKKILLKESRTVSFLERMSYLQHRMSVYWEDNRRSEILGEKAIKISLLRTVNWGLWHGGIAYLLQ